MVASMGSIGRLAPLLAALALLAAGCIGKNEAHCYYRGKTEFCGKNQPERPFCSVCAAENDGCVDVAPDSECAAGDASASDSTVAATAARAHPAAPAAGW